MQTRNRNLEARLLSAASLLFLYGLGASAYLAGRNPLWILGQGVMLVGFFFFVHYYLRKQAPDADPWLLPSTLAMLSLGIVVIYRLQTQLAASQIIWASLGLVAALMVIAWADLGVLRRYKYVSALLAAVLLIMPIFVGVEQGGAKLWVRWGFLNFQPAEPAKLMLSFFLAAYLSEKGMLIIKPAAASFKDRISLQQLGPILLIAFLALIILVLEKDLGTSLLIFGIFMSMLYLSTARMDLLAWGAGVFGIGAGISYFLFSHIQARFDIWANPWVDPAGRGYQLIQSKFSLAAGSIWGTGLWEGSPQRIPAAATDFAIAALGEELGLTGALAVLALVLLFAFRGLKIAITARSGFHRLLAGGLSVSFAVQAWVIMAGATGIIPLTGITLPFMSYGGSSMIANMLLLGLLLRIERERGEVVG